MKIGILTYHRAQNFGAVLQAYALSTFFKQQGFDVEIIDYWPQYRKEMQSIIPFSFWKLNSIKKIKALVKFIISFFQFLINYKIFNSKKNKFWYFTSKHFGINKNPLYTDGPQINKFYDVCIYGSDQIWRKFKLNGFQDIDKTYYGAYPENCAIKIAYAASMGEININEKDKLNIGNLLKNFNKISVREESLKFFLEKNYHVLSSLVCDPTFLMDKKDWVKIIPASLYIPEKKYLLYYNLHPSDLGKKTATIIAKHYRLSIIEIPEKFSNNIFKKYHDTTGPIEFLSLIRNSDFVISSSFHGVAFSIIFEKQFYALGLGKNADRVITTLAELSISNRYIHTIDEINFNDKIDYNRLNSSLINYRNKSLTFINESLKS